MTFQKAKMKTSAKIWDLLILDEVFRIVIYFNKFVYDFTYIMTKGDLFYKHYKRDNAPYIKRTPWL